MENKVLEENLKIIEKYDKELAKKIAEFEIENSNLEITQTQKKEYNLVYKGYCLHSPKGAIKEAKNIADTIEDKENELKVIFGLGLGYLADEISSKITKSIIIIYEKELEILKYVLSIAKIDALEKENVFICNDKFKLRDYVVNATDTESTMKLLFTKTYKEIFGEDIEEAKGLIQKSQGQNSANTNTILSKAPEALKYTYQNLKDIITSPYISQFKDIFKDKTALVISAGPSLKDNIKIIKENQDKFVIFCINVAMKYVLEQGIKPDFICDIETVESKAQYKNLDLSDSFLILEAFSNPKKYKSNPKQVVTYISKNNFLNPWVRDSLQIEDGYEAVGTVSYTALQSALIMGFKRIILIGQDLAYKDGLCYTKGSVYEDLKCVFDQKEHRYKIVADDIEKFAMKSIGSTSEKAIKGAQSHINFLSKNIFTVKGQNGKKLPSQAGYSLFIDWFERVAIEKKKQNPDLILINSSIGGAQIDGFENIELCEVVKTLEPFDKNLKKRKSVKYEKEHFKEKLKNHLQEIQDYRELALEVDRACGKFLKEIEIKKVLTPNILKLMKKHNDLLKPLLEYKFTPQTKIFCARYSFLIMDLIEKDFTKDINTLKDTFKKLKEIYEAIASITENSIESLTDCQSFVLE